MKTYTFDYTDQAKGHISRSVVTAETIDDCVEKYYLKYPDRLLKKVIITEGDLGPIRFTIGP